MIMDSAIFGKTAYVNFAGTGDRNELIRGRAEEERRMGEQGV